MTHILNTSLVGLLIACLQPTASPRSPMTAYKNDHLSYSRLSRFEQCPLSFKLHYIDGQQAEPGLPLRFGKAIHAVLEDLVRVHMDMERVSPLSVDHAIELWQREWVKQELVGVAVFEEGVDIIKRFVRDQGPLDHQDVLAVEQEFRLKVGAFEVLGYIDRIDRVDDETVEVIDYKSNRMLFTRDEVESSLQLSIYELAVRQLWPWVKKVKLTFNMLRHGVRQETERTPEQLETALRYVETMGRQTEETKDYPARLNPNCCWCDHRNHCQAYDAALQGERHAVCPDLEDLESVAQEREEVSNLAKALYARKRELESVLKGHLKEQDELVLGGMRYSVLNTKTKAYPLDQTLELLGEATGLSKDDLLDQIATIDNTKLNALLKKQTKPLGRSRMCLLKLELDSKAKKSYSPRLWAKAVTA